MEQKSFYSKVHLNLSPPFQLFLLFHLFRSLRWNRRNRWNTLPALPIPKKCCIPFTIPLLHLLFSKIVKGMQCQKCFDTLKKILNTQVRFVFQKFPFGSQNVSVCQELNRPRLVIVYWAIPENSQPPPPPPHGQH